MTQVQINKKIAVKIFKTFILISGFAFATAQASAQAQENRPDPGQVARLQTDRIKQHVTGITPAQESRLITIEKDYTKSLQDVLNTTDNSNKTALHSKINPLRETRDAKVKTILTADQYSEYEKYKPEYQGGK
jgi:formate dehydrogenase maturation protein FdhE